MSASQREVRKGEKELGVPGVAGLLGDMTGSVEADHRSGGE